VIAALAVAREIPVPSYRGLLILRILPGRCYGLIGAAFPSLRVLLALPIPCRTLGLLRIPMEGAVLCGASVPGPALRLYVPITALPVAAFGAAGLFAAGQGRLAYLRAGFSRLRPLVLPGRLRTRLRRVLLLAFGPVKRQQSLAVRLFYITHMAFCVHTHFLQLCDYILAGQVELLRNFMHSHFCHSPASVILASFSFLSIFAANPPFVTANTALFTTPVKRLKSAMQPHT